MKKYLEYVYLTGALGLLTAYGLWHAHLSTMETYGMLGGIMIFSFMYSIRRSIRRASSQNSRNTPNSPNP
jgi:hypothetical protein